MPGHCNAERTALRGIPAIAIVGVSPWQTFLSRSLICVPLSCVSRPPEVMTPAEAAEFLSLTVDTLFRYRKDAKGPRYCQTGDRTVRYLREDLVAWLKEGR